MTRRTSTPVPTARFDEDGQLEIRASAVGGCRRALWYTATGHRPSTTPTEDSLTVMEAGNALEPVVLRAMERAGWEVAPADPHDPKPVSVQLAPNLKVTGHPDATGVMPLFGGAAVIEVKTRGPGAFKHWQTLGAERSHPDSVAQAAVYTYGTFGEARDAVIATMDTASGAWDYEVIPADRGGAGSGNRPVPARRACRAPRPARRGPPRPAGAGLPRGKLAVQRLPLPEHLPAWTRAGGGGGGDRGKGGERGGGRGRRWSLTWRPRKR